MNSPSGISYYQVEKEIEAIAIVKGRQYGRIAFYDQEDIEQEVRIQCFKAIRKYNPEKSNHNVSRFLGVCSDNRIRDIKRSKVFKDTRPCKKCEFWDRCAAKEKQHDCTMFDDKTKCEKYVQYLHHCKSRMSINHPHSIDDNRTSTIDSFSSVMTNDFVLYMNTNMPSGQHLFNLLVSYNFNIDKMKTRDKEQLIPIMSGVLCSYMEE